MSPPPAALCSAFHHQTCWCKPSRSRAIVTTVVECKQQRALHTLWCLAYDRLQPPPLPLAAPRVRRCCGSGYAVCGWDRAGGMQRKGPGPSLWGHLPYQLPPQLRNLHLHLADDGLQAGTAWQCSRTVRVGQGRVQRRMHACVRASSEGLLQRRQAIHQLWVSPVPRPRHEAQRAAKSLVTCA